jgi:hypothetical protein
MRRMYRLFLALSLALVTSCVACATQGGAGRSPSPDTQTLALYNGTGTHIKVYIDGTKVGTATAGRNCLTIPRVLRSGQLGCTTTCSLYSPHGRGA